MTKYIFNLYVVSLLSNRFTASALVWFPNLLKCLALHFLFCRAPCSFVGFRGSCDCLYDEVHSEEIGEPWIGRAGGFRC
jgi:hypothetical protein